MASESQKRANEKWQKANYEFVKVRLYKGEKEKLKATAEQKGLSLNEYLRQAIFRDV